MPQVPARGKLGKLLGEPSGLMLTMTWFGGKGGSSNTALGVWRKELPEAQPDDELAAGWACLLRIQDFFFPRQSGSFSSFLPHAALFSSGPALGPFTMLSRLQVAGWFAISPAMHHHHHQTFPCLPPPGLCSCGVCISQDPADALIQPNNNLFGADIAAGALLVLLGVKGHQQSQKTLCGLVCQVY